MKCFKGFDKDLRCKGFQYEVGKEYETERAEIREEGFHACEFARCAGILQSSG